MSLGDRRHPRVRRLRPAAGVRFRAATPEDAAAFPEIEHSAGLAFLALPDLAWIAGEPDTDALVHGTDIAGGVAWVAEGPSGIAGFLTATRRGRDLHIENLMVAIDRQRRGIGARLLDLAIDRARRDGAASVTLTTFRGVPWNEPFYARLGFSVLDGPEIDDRLAALLAAEAQRGLPSDRRCAMRLALDPAPGPGRR